MYSGLHGDFEWDLVNGELVVYSSNRKIGRLTTFEAPTSFNNAEQAQWFAQSRIDIHGDELARLERAQAPPGAN
jgi:hypothetical protein